jgi:rhodanese-related sulfurtransferase
VKLFNDGRSLDAIDRETLLERVLHAKAIVIDVRPSAEYITAHLPHALAIPLEELEERLVKLPDNKEIVARTIPAGYSGRDFGGCTVCP